MEVNKENNMPLEAQAAAALDKINQTTYSVNQLWKSHVTHERIDVNKMTPGEYRKVKRAFYGGVSQLLALQAGPLSKLKQWPYTLQYREFPK